MLAFTSFLQAIFAGCNRASVEQLQARTDGQALTCHSFVLVGPHLYMLSGHSPLGLGVLRSRRLFCTLTSCALAQFLVARVLRLIRGQNGDDTP